MNLDKELNVNLPLKHLLMLWHFCNDQSAQEAFFNQYAKTASTQYRIEARNLLMDFIDFETINNIMDQFDIHPDQLSLNSSVVQLNKDYTAIIDEDGIHVDCQTFSFKKLRELWKESKKFRKK